MKRSRGIALTAVFAALALALLGRYLRHKEDTQDEA